MKNWIILSVFVPILGFTQPTDEACLAVNTYMEARGETYKGMQAVADVVLNRMKHSAFKGQNSACKVVFAPNQFSWVKQQPKKATHRLMSGDLRGLKDKDVLAYQKAVLIATEALSEGYKPLLPSSVVSFHNTGVNPSWASKMKKYGKIGQHVFYGFKRKG